MVIGCPESITAALPDPSLAARADGTLILARHAQVEIRKDVPSREWCLSAAGRAAAAIMARAMANLNPTLVVTSSECKARETGEIVAAELDLSQLSAPGLGEHDRIGAPVFQDRADFLAAVTELLNRPDEVIFGTESGNEALQRFSAAVYQVTAANGDGTVAIVTHGTVMALFLARHNNALDVVNLWQGLTLPCFFALALPGFTIRRCYYTD